MNIGYASLLLLAAQEASLAANPAARGDTAFPVFAPRVFPDSLSGARAFRETLSPVDIDGDGDLDFFSGEGRGGKEFWFENRGSGSWLRHLVSDSNDADVGAAVADVDGDGDWDRLAGGFVHLNPGPGQPGPFATLRTGAPGLTHDLLAGDIDDDGRPDLITLDDAGIRWHSNPGPPYADWPRHPVSGLDSVPHHGGLALGDFDEDGDWDIARTDCWFENQDGGRTWRRRFGPEFGRVDARFPSMATRAVAEDIDMDGDVDLALAECDLDNGRVAWFENRYLGEVWIPHLVKDSVDGQDFHSLVLADFDGDGDKDFFSCGSALSRDAPQGYVWENLERGWTFREHVIRKDAAGAHASAAFDMDGDGDADILGADSAGSHSWLENLRRHGGSGRLAVPGKPAWRLEARAWWAGKGAVGFHPPGAPAPARDGLGRALGSYPVLRRSSRSGD